MALLRRESMAGADGVILAGIPICLPFSSNAEISNMISVQHMTCSRSHLLVQILYGVLLLWTKEMDGLADFSNYLSKILSSHARHAYDGEKVVLQCPRHSTISIQSAFYGHSGMRTSDPGKSLRCKKDGTCCSASAALQKMLSECQGKRDCHLLVNSGVFGLDPCPGTPKYLDVSYRCKPTEHKKKVGCEGDTLLLHCKQPRVLVIYAATYGREPWEGNVCVSDGRQQPPFECLYHGAVNVVSKLCYGKQRCFITIDQQHLMDPCPPGTSKHLTVLYSCVPLALLKEADPLVVRTTLVPKPTTEDAGELQFPKSAKLPERQSITMSSFLMAYGYITEHPEMAALLFISCVCGGLLIALLAVSVRLSCSRRPHRGAPTSRKCLIQEEEQMTKEEEEEEEDSDSDLAMMNTSLLSELSRKVYGWEDGTYTTEAAELMERMERRELVVQEIWMNAYLNGTC